MLKWILGTLLGIIFGISGYFYWYLGGFKSVTITEKEMGPLVLIYKEHIGAYHKIVPKIQEVETWAKEHKIPCTQTFGEYFDNPQTVEEGRLKSHGGCVVTSIPQELPPEIKSETIPAQNFVTALFEGSPGIGPMKVYPRAEKYFEIKKWKMGSPIFEIYEVHSATAMTTTYLFPIQK